MIIIIKAFGSFQLPQWKKQNKAIKQQQQQQTHHYDRLLIIWVVSESWGAKDVYIQVDTGDFR